MNDKEIDQKMLDITMFWVQQHVMNCQECSAFHLQRFMELSELAQTHDNTLKQRIIDGLKEDSKQTTENVKE